MTLRDLREFDGILAFRKLWNPWNTIVISQMTMLRKLKSFKRILRTWKRRSSKRPSPTSDSVIFVRFPPSIQDFDWQQFVPIISGEPYARKGLIIGIVLMLLNQLCGVLTILTYSASIFQASGSKFDPAKSSIISAVFQVVGTLTASQLVDRVGRKLLLVVSLCGSSFGLAVMGTYQYIYEQGIDVSSFDWLPVTSLSFVVLLASIGAVPLPFVVIAEVLPLKLRSIGCTVCMVAVTIFAFVCLKAFPVWTEVIRLYGCMWIFASGSLVGVLFVVFYMEETKGKVLDSFTHLANSIAVA